MQGLTNSMLTPYTASNTIRYSYDGIIWKKFSTNGTDANGCATIDFNTNIIQINASGYDSTNNKLVYDNNGTFYLKFKRNCNIYYCLVGGGGGGSGGARARDLSNWITRGGGGGSGGQVLYNKIFYTCLADDIIRIQIGDGGNGGGGHGNLTAPAAGGATSLYLMNLDTNSQILIQQALGGPGAALNYSTRENVYEEVGDYRHDIYIRYGSSDGGTGIQEVDNSNLYSKSSPGGAGTLDNNSNSSDSLAGTIWPINNVCYGGGGGGAGGRKYDHSGQYSYQWSEALYSGMAGGTGGGGAGGLTNGSWTGASLGNGQPGTLNFGGGGGGSNADSSSGSGKGGAGTCLIKFG